MRTATNLFPALYGEPVTEWHANLCRERGHASHTVDGVASLSCPRCGEVVTPETREVVPARCAAHPAFEADYCPSCGTAAIIPTR